MALEGIRGRSPIDERSGRRGGSTTTANGARDLVLISDATTCTEEFAHLLRYAGVDASVEDVVAFAVREILPRVAVVKPALESLVLHPTYSSTQRGLNPDLETIANSVAASVTVPDS